jgi:hypothetical protein
VDGAGDRKHPLDVQLTVTRHDSDRARRLNGKNRPMCEFKYQPLDGLIREAVKSALLINESKNTWSSNHRKRHKELPGHITRSPFYVSDESYNDRKVLLENIRDGERKVKIFFNHRWAKNPDLVHSISYSFREGYAKLVDTVSVVHAGNTDLTKHNLRGTTSNAAFDASVHPNI